MSEISWYHGSNMDQSRYHRSTMDQSQYHGSFMDQSRYHGSNSKCLLRLIVSMETANYQTSISSPHKLKQFLFYNHQLFYYRVSFNYIFYTLVYTCKMNRHLRQWLITCDSLWHDAFIIVHVSNYVLIVTRNYSHHLSKRP